MHVHYLSTHGGGGEHLSQVNKSNTLCIQGLLRTEAVHTGTYDKHLDHCLCQAWIYLIKKTVVYTCVGTARRF